MSIIIIIFLVAIISLLGMVMFQAWKIKTSQKEIPELPQKIIPELYFRHVEKIMLHLAKYAIQWIVLMVVKYWFIIHTKLKNWGGKEWPRIYNFFKKKEKELYDDPKKYSFVQRSVLELKTKIRHTREKVRREHGEI